MHIYGSKEKDIPEVSYCHAIFIVIRKLVFLPFLNNTVIYK